MQNSKSLMLPSASFPDHPTQLKRRLRNAACRAGLASEQVDHLTEQLKNDEGVFDGLFEENIALRLRIAELEYKIESNAFPSK